MLIDCNHAPLTTHHSSLTTHHAPRTTHHTPRTTHHASRTTHHAPLTTHHSPRTTHHAPLTTHHAPLTTHHSPRTTHHSPLTTYHSPEISYPSFDPISIFTSGAQNQVPRGHWHSDVDATNAQARRSAHLRDEWIEAKYERKYADSAITLQCNHSAITLQLICNQSAIILPSIISGQDGRRHELPGALYGLAASRGIGQAALL